MKINVSFNGHLGENCVCVSSKQVTVTRSGAAQSNAFHCSRIASPLRRRWVTKIKSLNTLTLFSTCVALALPLFRGCASSPREAAAFHKGGEVGQLILHPSKKRMLKIKSVFVHKTRANII